MVNPVAACNPMGDRPPAAACFASRFSRYNNNNSGMVAGVALHDMGC